MKNVLIIDGAENCTYDVFQLNDDEFIQVFGNREIVFIEDLVADETSKAFYDPIFTGMWGRRIDKKDAMGTHGTIFYEQYYKKRHFPGGSWDG